MENKTSRINGTNRGVEGLMNQSNKSNVAEIKPNYAVHDLAPESKALFVAAEIAEKIKTVDEKYQSLVFQTIETFRQVNEIETTAQISKKLDRYALNRSRREREPQARRLRNLWGLLS